MPLPRSRWPQEIHQSIKINTYILYKKTTYLLISIYFDLYYMKKQLIFLILTTIVLTWCTTNTSQLDSNSKNEQEQRIIQQRIFVLWDSLTAWYQLAYEDSYPAQLERKLQDIWYNIKVINAWESWDTSAWLKSRLSRITADALSGDIALIVIGGNDGLQWLSTDALENNIRNIIITLQNRGLITIIGGMQIPTNLWTQYRNTFAGLYPRVASETNTILIPFILSWVAGIPELNLPDGIHPNTTGQTIISQTVIETLITNNLIKKP